MAFARAARPEKQRIFALGDEDTSGEVEHQAAVHLRVEREVEVVKRAIGIAEGGLFAAALQQSIGAAREFVRDEGRDQIDGRHGFRLGLAEASFQHGGHAAEPQLAERAFQFNEVHGSFSWWSWVRLSMKSP